MSRQRRMGMRRARPLLPPPGSRVQSCLARARLRAAAGREEMEMLRARVLMLFFTSEDNESRPRTREPRAGFRRPFSTFGLHARGRSKPLFSVAPCGRSIAL